MAVAYAAGIVAASSNDILSGILSHKASEVMTCDAKLPAPRHMTRSPRARSFTSEPMREITPLASTPSPLAG